MSELRWVLLLLGALVIGLTWALGTGRLQAFFSGWRRGRVPQESRLEPVADLPAPESGHDYDDEGEHDRGSPSTAEPEADRTRAPAIDRVVTLRFVPRGKPLRADATVLAMRAVGLRHGQYGIFHMYPDESSQDSLFSVANLTEPGSFDLSNLTEATIPGMNFFLVLPGIGDPVDRFDRMVDTARELARSLDAELRDERGSSWSIQRERYVREEVIEYRHQSEGTPGH